MTIQRKDKIKYDDKIYKILNDDNSLPKHSHYSNGSDKKDEKIVGIGLHIKNVRWVSDCWRGNVSEFEVKNDRLYLISMHGIGYKKMKFDKEMVFFSGKLFLGTENFGNKNDCKIEHVLTFSKGYLINSDYVDYRYVTYRNFIYYINKHYTDVDNKVDKITLEEKLIKSIGDSFNYLSKANKIPEECMLKYDQYKEIYNSINHMCKVDDIILAYFR